VKRVASVDLARLKVMLIHALATSEFLDRCCVKDPEETNHCLFRRLILPARHADVWQWMLRQWLW
jgi:hypothetical protein